MATSFFHDNQFLHDGKNLFIQWTSEDRAKCSLAGSNNHSYDMTKKKFRIDNETTFLKSAIRILSYISIKKRTTQRSKSTCFIYKSTEHLFNKSSERFKL